MDPNENLEGQLQLADWMLHATMENANDVVLYVSKSQQLAELVLALNDWMEAEGFPPERWRRERGSSGKRGEP